MGVGIPEEVKNMFNEQLTVSTQALQKYEKDVTAEGTKKFYHHAKILGDIKSRIDIFVDSQESEKEIKEILLKL
ncbi:hypothetical protein [Sporosarcina limicola]|uniref:L-fucose isomerase-like protein n=1 Tax=Sporosarcina limicola TaxID=34101 RepID=A0A927MLN2_9BACL|nr:hypothetical protein [Sporosarcina limicola]MBE1557000.1 L-fucose isomerase-like protein [Sporosarcina limicola]